MNLNDLMESFEFNDKERALSNASFEGWREKINQLRMISEIAFIKRLEKVADRMIESNENYLNPVIGMPKECFGLLWLLYLQQLLR